MSRNDSDLNEKRDDSGAADPAFDGHLEWPLQRMTPEQRLQWLDEAVRLLHLGREQRQARRRASEEQA